MTDQLFDLLDEAPQEVYDPDEFLNWLDTGFEVSRDCLDCPLPQCRHDLPLGMASAKKEARGNMAHSLAGQGWGNADLARLLDCSVRTIQRYLSRTPPAGAPAQPSAPA